MQCIASMSGHHGDMRSNEPHRPCRMAMQCVPRMAVGKTARDPNFASVVLPTPPSISASSEVNYEVPSLVAFQHADGHCAFESPVVARSSNPDIWCCSVCDRFGRDSEQKYRFIASPKGE